MLSVPLQPYSAPHMRCMYVPLSGASVNFGALVFCDVIPLESGTSLPLPALCLLAACHLRTAARPTGGTVFHRRGHRLPHNTARPAAGAIYSPCSCPFLLTRPSLPPPPLLNLPRAVCIAQQRQLYVLLHASNPHATPAMSTFSPGPFLHGSSSDNPPRTRMSRLDVAAAVPAVPAEKRGKAGRVSSRRWSTRQTAWAF